MGRISLYRRINATDTISSNYVFEEMKTFWIKNGCVWEPHRANLDGNIGNDKESIVMGYSANGSLVYPYSGLLTLTPEDNGNYTLSGIAIAQDIHYPYVKIYSKTVIIDANKDGYDDAIIYCREKDSFELNYGDLILFFNCYKDNGYSKVFQYKEGSYLILLYNECISWGVTTQQLDSDEDLETQYVVL